MFISAGEEIVSGYDARRGRYITEGTNGGAPAAREIIFGTLPTYLPGPLPFIFIVLHHANTHTHTHMHTHTTMHTHTNACNNNNNIPAMKGSVSGWRVWVWRRFARGRLENTSLSEIPSPERTRALLDRYCDIIISDRIRWPVKSSWQYRSDTNNVYCATVWRQKTWEVRCSFFCHACAES